MTTAPQADSVPATRPAGPAVSSARRMLRLMACEVRDFPATALLSACWVIVFVAMVWLQFRQGPSPSWSRLLVLGMGDVGHRFGDLTLREIFGGQVWRLITCNFIHYSVIHIVLNLTAFYLLGTLVESWYGSGQLVLIYGLTGVGGNLLSALARHALGWSPLSHAGGGSVVVMGLIGLCAVVGWRSRSERGSELGWQMAKALGLTTLLGVVFRRYIDNMGHAGGTVAGIVLGFFHRGFLQRNGSPGAWGAGLVTSLVMVASGLAQYRYDRAEAPVLRELAGWRDLLATRRNLDAREDAYRTLRHALDLIAFPDNAPLLGPLLDRAAPVLDQEPIRADFDRLRVLAQTAASQGLLPEERAEFQQRGSALAEALRAELRNGNREYREERAGRLPLRIQRREPTGPLESRAPAR